MNRYEDPVPYENDAITGGNAFDVSHYTGLILRYRWLIIIPFCLSMLVGIYLALTLPKLYESKTLILVEPQKVPSNYVRSIVGSDIESRISTISQQIKSRTNLEKIIKQFDLFSGPQYGNMFLEDKLAELRKRIIVTVSRSDDRKKIADAFSISFRGKDPQKVMRITNTLASFFINENIKVRESYAIGTRMFLADELDNMRKRLEKVEGVLKQYRQKYMGELPEQLDSNLKMLDRLQEQVSQRQQLIRDEKNRLAMVENEIQIERERSSVSAGEDGKGNVEPNTLEGLKKLLAEYKSRYTSQHPDVIRTEKKIREMEQSLAAGGTSKGKKDIDAETAVNKVLAGLILQRDAIRREILSRQQELARLSREINVYQARVENTPKREQELLGLQRDYENIKTIYDSMLERKLEADIAVNMEKKQKGEQFRVLDPANLPQKPVSPNMRNLFLMCALIGLGAGGGIVLLKDFLDGSVSKPEDVQNALGLELLAAIPQVVHTRDLVLRRLNTVASIAGVLVSLGLLACFAAVTVLDYKPAVLLVTRYIKEII